MMDDLHFRPISQGYGWLIGQTPQEVINEFKTPISKLQKNFEEGIKYNDNLVGEIQHEFALPVGKKFTRYIKEMASSYDKITKYITYNNAEGHYTKNKHNLSTGDAWVNFQQKHEYNPLHHHSGVLSYVLWYKIPYTLEKEREYTYKSDRERCVNGDFVFYFPQIVNDRVMIVNQALSIDKSKEGMFAIFPSSLNHSVMPFYSTDDYRITIAGNIYKT